MSEPFTLYDVLLQTLLSYSCGHAVKRHCLDENLHGDVNVNPSAHDFTQLITGVQIQVLMILDGDLDQATKARQRSRSQVEIDRLARSAA